MRLLREFFSDKNAATAIEYGLITAMMGVAIISGYGALTGDLGNVFNKVEVAAAKAFE